MVYSLAYRQPAYVTPEMYALQRAEREAGDSRDGSLRLGKSGRNSGIPAALAFDKIITGGTCPVSMHFLDCHVRHGSRHAWGSAHILFFWSKHV